MSPSSTAERFDQINLHATRANSLLTVLIHHYTSPDRHNELNDTQLVDMLELVEEALDKVRECARETDLAGAA